MPGEVASFVRAAIADRYKAGDIPDQNLIAKDDSVLVFDEMEESGYQVSNQALPSIDGIRFALVDRTAARDRAYGTHRGTYMLEVDRVEMGSDTERLKIGIGVYPDIAMPNAVWMCCCSAAASFRLLDGQWSFVAWDSEICH
jgi:hypothetical protein